MTFTAPVLTDHWWMSLNSWSQIANLVIAVLGLGAIYQLVLARRSLQLAQDDIQTRLQREAKQHAADLCRRFAEQTIPQYGRLETALAGTKTPLQAWPLVDYSFSPTSIPDADGANVWIRSAEGSGELLIKMLNELESVAMYFVSGIADERLAFPSLSRMYCAGVERLAPILISLRTNTVGSGQFPNVVALYELWNERIRLHTAMAERAELDRRAANISSREIVPFGIVEPKKQ
jgi:hypothetical protein